MAENCSHECGSCSAGCASRPNPADFIVKPHPDSRVKRVIGIVSGKGGVGKSTVTSLLAVALRRRGHKVGILDADITGPSIPKLFGVTSRPGGSDTGIYPVETDTGISIISLNLLAASETDPVIWRGPVISGVVTQFWKDVIWGEVDFLLVDMPPGTGDVALTVFQSMPVDGIIVVTSPQSLVSMIVTKAVNMAKMMNIPMLGLVENYSYFKCPGCGEKHAIFGESHLDKVAKSLMLDILGQLPMDPAVAAAGDRGEIETAAADGLEKAVEKLEAMPPKN